MEEKLNLILKVLSLWLQNEYGAVVDDLVKEIETEVSKPALRLIEVKPEPKKLVIPEEMFLPQNKVVKLRRGRPRKHDHTRARRRRAPLPSQLQVQDQGGVGEHNEVNIPEHGEPDCET